MTRQTKKKSEMEARVSSERELRLAAEVVKLKAEEDRRQVELALRTERQRRFEVAEEAAASRTDLENLAGYSEG